MKMSKIISLILVVVMIVACLASCVKPDDPNKEPEKTTIGDGDTVVKVWCSELVNDEGYAVTEQFEEQIKAFLAANPDYNSTYCFEVSGMSEADSASQVLTDIALAPDLFCFAQDQLARLVQADALAQPGQQATANVKASNDAISVSAASVAGQLYAYPLTSDNGYYMYYDKSVVKNPEDLASIVADCEAAGKNICFELENAWYTASFFMATGCISNWTMSEEGKFTSVEDTWNSDAGVIAMRGMQIVTKSEYYVNDSKTFEGAGIVVTGIWNANTAEAVLGENFGVADLPSFTVDGETYHLGSFSGNKLMGVKPQEDSAKVAMLHKLAQYLTNTECQLERYDAFQWGPSNLEAQADPDVKANVSLLALAAQNEYAIPQGNIHGSWWDIAKLLGGESKNAGKDNVEDLKAALDTYEDTINGLLQLSDEELLAWSVIGNLEAIKDAGWNVDYPMTKKSDGVYESEALDFAAGAEFKCRQGASWTVNFGSDGKIDGPNVVVETAGKYIVRLTVHSETSATIELVPAN